MSFPQNVQPRYRNNAKQTAKGAWQLDCTVELGDDHIIEYNHPGDLGNITEVAIGQKLLAIVKETETAFQKDGKQMAGGGAEQ